MKRMTVKFILFQPVISLVLKMQFLTINLMPDIKNLRSELIGVGKLNFQKLRKVIGNGTGVITCQPGNSLVNKVFHHRNLLHEL